MLSAPVPRPSSTDHSFFSSSRSSKPGTSSSTVVVRTRLAHVKPTAATQSRLLPSTGSQLAYQTQPPPSPPLQQPQPMPGTANKPPKKRKSSTSTPLPRNVKKLRAAEQGSRRASKVHAAAGSSTTSSRSSSRPNTHPPSPEPIYRSSRSRSVSAFHNPEPPIQSRPCWIEEDGTPGPAFLSSETVVTGLTRHYKSYFKNIDDRNDQSFEPHNLPVAELEYPNTGACERFLLLAPKDKDHYNPIFCLEKSLYTIIESYLTPEQQHKFGTLPTIVLFDISPHNSPPPSPSPSPPHSSDSNSSRTSTLTSLTSSSSSSSSQLKVNYLRAIQRAIHQRDGPLFLKTINTINTLLRSLKYPKLPLDICAPNPVNSLKETVRSWTDTGIPQQVLMRIVEETYQRAVGPHVQTLRNYEAFSSEVYGELMPPFVSDIVRTTGLGKDSLLMDLGSGVGNIVMHASLQSGCRSFGIELMPAPAKVAREQLEQFKIRCKMWGVSMGDVELEEGDMLKSERVNELIPKADVVLINNKVFLESLNEALRPKFLDLKEGAVVVSLKPFVSSLNARVTERNVDDMSAIFDVTERPYRSGSVSWGSSSGTYYVHRVAREEYASMRQRFESSRSNRIKRQRS